MIVKNFNLKNHNTFGISIECAEFASIQNISEINTVLSEKKSEELMILGGGSNILFTKHYNGLILQNNIVGITKISENENSVILECGAGEIWHNFVLYTIKNKLGGIENLSLIPGRVGASPMQNIGAYGVEIKDVFLYLDAYHIKSKQVRRFNKEECNFGYRDSIFKNELKNQYIILKVAFELNKKPIINTSYGIIEKQLESMNVLTPTIEDVSNAIITIRSSKLPNPEKIGNAGSFFKNPVVDIEVVESLISQYKEVPTYPIAERQVKLAAGWLIEKAGWKGFKEKNFGVHNNQALVLVNYGGCSGTEILDLSNKIIDDVKNKFNVTLEREVNIL